MGSLSCCRLSPGGGGQVVFAETPDSEGFYLGFLFHVPESSKVKVLPISAQGLCAFGAFTRLGRAVFGNRYAKMGDL